MKRGGDSEEECRPQSDIGRMHGRTQSAAQLTGVIIADGDVIGS